MRLSPIRSYSGPNNNRANIIQRLSIKSLFSELKENRERDMHNSTSLGSDVQDTQYW